MNVAQGGNGSSSTVGNWIRNSVSRSSFGHKTSAPTNAHSGGSVMGGWQTAAAEWLGVGAELEQVDPAAAFHTFSKHWQQTCEIMEKTRSKKQVCTQKINNSIFQNSIQLI